MYGSGSADNVKTTCNWRGQDEHVGARARSQVYTSGNSRRNIRELEGTKGQQIEYYVQAEYARS